MIEEEELSQQQFVWLLGAACRLHRLPFDPQLLLGRFPPPYTLASARQALDELGRRSGLADTPPTAFAARHAGAALQIPPREAAPAAQVGTPTAG